MFIHQRRRVVHSQRRRRRTPRVVEAVTRSAGLVGLLGLTATVIAFGATAVASAATWSVSNPPFQATSNVPFAPLQGVSAISAGNAWAVGRDDGAPLTEHWNGSKWSSVALPAGPCSVFENDCQLTGVSADSASDAIAVGNGVLNSNSSAGWIAVPLAFHWNGGGWQPMTLPSSLPSSALDHVQAFSLTDAWAVGNGSSGSASVALAEQWNGTTWNEVPTPISTTVGLSINAISGSSASDIWVVGETMTSGYHNRHFTSVIMHYDGSSWTLSSVPDQSGLRDVKALSPTDAWALAADGSVLNWNGTSWTAQTQEPGATVLTALSPTDVWVGGVVSLGHYNGSTWSTTPTPSAVLSLTGAAASAPGHVWLVGVSALSNGDEVPLALSTSNG